ncbi:MAG TPA: outer membrane beta-barrel protein [Mucilaginibacter sp.]|jgi:hypothetical protein|nr:outer membrane beta-barrel protein [Mucilaginibacter sp.]
MFALCLITVVSFAQNKASIKGKVIDSITKIPIERATVAVLDIRDATSLLLSYTITDKSGNFVLHNPPTDIPLRVFISLMGYKPFRKNLTLKKGETLDLGAIEMSSKELSEVVIKGDRPPIAIRKDTIEFNAEAFKTRPNAVVEDLLKKLPGVEVEMDGTVMIYGKPVSKILTDGHEFFKDNYRIATKNLDVDMIDKVQVYDDRENDPDHLIPESQVNKIINLKFKKAFKKNYFGKFYAGGGTQDHYSAGGLFNMFRDTLQISILGQGNNINNTSFSYNDLNQSAGFTRGGSDAFYRGGSLNNGTGLFSLSGGSDGRSGTVGSGLRKTYSGGININTDYGKKLKINLAYYYSRNVTDVNSISRTQRFLGDTIFFSSSQNPAHITNTPQNLSASIQWHPNDATQLIYNPFLTFTDNELNAQSTSNTHTNFVSQLSDAVYTSTNSTNNTQFTQSLTFNHRFKKKGESINISHNLNISPGSGDAYSITNLTSYNVSLPSYLLNRFTNSVNKSMNGSINVSYQYPLTKKLTATIGLNSGYSHDINNSLVYDFNDANGLYDAFQLNLSNTLTRNLWNNSIIPKVSYNFTPRIKLELSASLQSLKADNKFGRGLPDIDQQYNFIHPGLNLNIGSYSFSYRTNTNLPNIGDMVPYTIVYSPLYSITGNPNLKPIDQNVFSMNYNTYLMKNQVSIYGNANATFDQNSVFRHQTLNSIGATTSTPVNMGSRSNYSFSGGINKTFKKTNNFQFSTNTSISGGVGHGYFEINQQSGFQNNYNYSLRETLNLNWKDKVILGESFTLNNSITKYVGIDYSNVNYITDVSNSHFIFILPKKFNIEGDYTLYYNPNVSPGFQKSTSLLNLTIARQIFAKDRGEIKLSCYDLLNQSVGSYRYVMANSITDVQDSQIRRYLLLTLQYKFNKAIIKK